MPITVPTNFPYAILYLDDPVSGAGAAEKYYWTADNASLTALSTFVPALAAARIPLLAKGGVLSKASYGIESFKRARYTSTIPFKETLSSNGSPGFGNVSLLYEASSTNNVGSVIAHPADKYLFFPPSNILTDYGVDFEENPTWLTAWGKWATVLKSGWGYKANLSPLQGNQNLSIFSYPTINSFGNLVVQVPGYTGTAPQVIVQGTKVRIEGSKSK